MGLSWAAAVVCVLWPQASCQLRCLLRDSGDWGSIFFMLKVFCCYFYIYSYFKISIYLSIYLSIYSFFLGGLFWFGLVWFFETGFLCATLAVLELTL
jgi:hypothetical protein